MKRSAKWAARALQLAFRLFPSTPRQLTFEGADITPTLVVVQTRHGPVRCHVYRPPFKDLGESFLPVYVNFHGGAFIVRQPRQDEHACRFIAASTGAVVINVDYDTAPAVQYPIAEQQALDVCTWIQDHSLQFGWEPGRLMVGGFSAGAKLAINVCQQIRDIGRRMPIALVACYPALNMTLAPAAREESMAGSWDSAHPKPVVAPWLIKLMYDTYFAEEARRGESLASPEFDADLASFPPALVLTGGLDSLGPEARRFAASLVAQGVEVHHRVFTDSDHGMTHNLPADVAREALELIAEHIVQALAVSAPPSFHPLQEFHSCSIAASSPPGSPP